MKIAYQKYPLVGNYTHPWVLLKMASTRQIMVYQGIITYNMPLISNMSKVRIL